VGLSHKTLLHKTVKAIVESASNTQVCTHIHTYIHTYTHTYIHIHTPIYTYIHTYILKAIVESASNTQVRYLYTYSMCMFWCFSSVSSDLYLLPPVSLTPSLYIYLYVYIYLYIGFRTLSRFRGNFVGYPQTYLPI
jgi:hypothetical protein